MVVRDSPLVCARIGDGEWTVECGNAECGVVLADVAWVDIDHNMASNAAEASGVPLDLGRLPAPHLRRYRMCVMFPFEWQFDEGGKVWRAEGSQVHRRGDQVGATKRIVRGAWSVGELTQMGVPPLVLVCPACGEAQTVAPLRRKNTPDPSLIA